MTSADRSSPPPDEESRVSEGVTSWKSLPTWYLVAEGTRRSRPGAERQFAHRMGATTVEVPSNHVAMVSHPGDVVNLIEAATEAVPAAP
jgi:hypothetical protein